MSRFFPVCCLLFSATPGQAVCAQSPSVGFKQTRVLPAAEAVQAAAATANHVFAITSDKVAVYTRKSGQRIGVSLCTYIAQDFQAAVPISSLLLFATLLKGSTFGFKQLLAPRGHVSDRFSRHNKPRDIATLSSARMVAGCSCVEVVIGRAKNQTATCALAFLKIQS